MILSPFGPYIYKGKLIEVVRKQLLADAFDAAVEGGDASGILVGEVEDQLFIYPSDEVLRSIHGMTRDYLGKVNGDRCMLDCEPIWVNFSVAGDWQPVHSHDGDFSFVAFVDVPDGMYDESPAAGAIHFTYGEKLPGSRSVYGPIKPEKGDVFIFPNWLNHYVYPFKSSGQRISVSGNISVQGMEASY
tara:strand:+ start:57 stop:620 length:564 start_codon:yes stop_codon:yes gene_type:complete